MSRRIFPAGMLGFFGAVFFLPVFSLAYPEFIGYGYTSCLTCHVNSLGSGPLNDYGRALWSAEIASRQFYPDRLTDEDLGARSGFLGSVALPNLFKPHIKYRGLNLRTNPGSTNSDTTKYYQMQTDLGFTSQFDENGRYLISATWGRVVRPEEYGAARSTFERTLAREYYFRMEVIPTWWIFVGQMDKVFGLRQIDHSSYQRYYQGFGQKPNDLNGMSESQGIVVHKIEEKWELATNYFIGNSASDGPYKEHGVSVLGEFDLAEKKRMGLSVLSQKSDVLTKSLAALHYKQGLSKGSAFLFEYGLIQDQEPLKDRTVGSYNLVEGFLLLSRGYNLKVAVERYNKEFKPTVPDQWKWIVGLFAFPAPRFEIRADLINQRQFSNTGANDDAWAVEGQIHVSL